MRRTTALVMLLILALPCSRAADPAAALRAEDLIGTWSGTLTHGAQSTDIALHIPPTKDEKHALAVSVPAIHLDHAPLGPATLVIDTQRVKLGAFDLQYDAATGTLAGNMPKELVPVYTLSLRLRKDEGFTMPERKALVAPDAQPVWTYDAGSALWAGPRVHEGAVYVGAQDGKLHAVDARTHQARWIFQTGGALRVRPSVDATAVYAQADDGYLYAIDVRSGKARWRAQINRNPVERLPFDNPKSRFDRFGSDVVIDGETLYLGTHEGRVLALNAQDGTTRWAYTTGDAVLAAPAIHQGRLYVGSFDHHVYALNAARGALLWTYDTGEAVVSTPAVSLGKVLVGTRGYDFIALNAATGALVWKQYLWFSWVESNAIVRDGVAYVGSSDAAATYAFDVDDGARRWSTDVHGWAWGEPAVTDRRVYTGTSSQVGYPAQHAGSLLALERATGRVAWRFVLPRPQQGAYGFPGSAATDGSYVYASDLDGKLYAFTL